MAFIMNHQLELKCFTGKFHSRHLNRQVRFRWVIPPGYGAEQVALPVLLMNDGQDFSSLGLEKTLASAYASKTLSPFIYVGLETGGQRVHEYGTAVSADFKGRGEKAGAYSLFVIEEFLPFLKARFKLSERPEDWVFCGMSLGGLSAFDVVYNNPSYFGKVGVFSGSFWWRNKAYVKHDMEDRSRILLDVIRDGVYSPHLKFWFQCGTEDETADRNRNGVIDSIDDTLDVIRELELRGYARDSDIRYVEVEGGRHDLPTWGRQFPEFIRWAFTKP